MSQALSEMMFLSIVLFCLMFLLYLANVALVNPTKVLLKNSTYILTIFVFMVILLFGFFNMYLHPSRIAYGLGYSIPALIAIIIFLPKTRYVISQQLSINDHNPVHTLSLAFSMIIIINMWTTLAQGLANLNKTTHADSAMQAMIKLWSQDLLIGLLALIGVGWLSRRTFREACRRLGFKMPSWKEIGIALCVAFLLSLFSVGVEHFSESTGIGINPQGDAIREKTMGPLDDRVLGLLSLGAGAAIGEEALYRGALQPRFGIFVTTILFTLSHTNYGFSIGTFVVFIGGLVIGWTRYRYHLVSAMIVHASYNIFISILYKWLKS